MEKQKTGKIEVTPEMAAAGAAVLNDSGCLVTSQGAAAWRDDPSADALAEQVFRAMWKSRAF